MYFKRNTDLFPLGKPLVENDWKNLVPIDIRKNSIDDDTYYTEQQTYEAGYSSLNKNHKQAIPISDANNVSEILRETLVQAFQESCWNTTKNSDITYTNAKLYVTNSSESAEDEITSEYYPKALWFEVAIAKDENDKPVSILDSENIEKYQYKKMNGYNLLCKPDLMHKDITQVEKSDLNVSANTVFQFIKANTAYISELYTPVISANNIEISDLCSDFGKFKTMYIDIGNISAISSDIARQINYLHGRNLYYPNYNLVQQNDIYADTVYVDNVKILNSIEIDEISSNKLKENTSIDNVSYIKHLGMDVSANIGFSGIASYFIADCDLSEGELIRFGRTINTPDVSEATITRAGKFDNTHYDPYGNVHGIVVPDTIVTTIVVPSPPGDEETIITDLINLDTHGIVLNTNLKKKQIENPSSIKGYLKLVHLYGISPMAKIHGPIGIHDISSENHLSITTHKRPHHRAGWEISGCCECSGDVGIGAKLYLSEISLGLFCTEEVMNNRPTHIYNTYNVPHAFVLEPTDNGSGLNYESGYTETCAWSSIPSAIRKAGGRQAKVYFNVEL